MFGQENARFRIALWTSRSFLINSTKTWASSFLLIRFNKTISDCCASTLIISPLQPEPFQPEAKSHFLVNPYLSRCFTVTVFVSLPFKLCIDSHFLFHLRALVQALLILLQWLHILNWFLEDNAILMLDRNIFQLAISLAVAGTVMLDFDNYTPDFAHWEIEHVLNDGCITAGYVRICCKTVAPLILALWTKKTTKHKYLMANML